jgi:hypothetical protein
MLRRPPSRLVCLWCCLSEWTAAAEGCCDHCRCCGCCRCCAALPRLSAATAAATRAAAAAAAAAAGCVRQRSSVAATAGNTHMRAKLCQQQQQVAPPHRTGARTGARPVQRAQRTAPAATPMLQLTVLWRGPSRAAGSMPRTARLCSAAVSALPRLLHSRHVCHATSTPHTGRAPYSRHTSSVLTRDCRPASAFARRGGGMPPVMVTCSLCCCRTGVHAPSTHPACTRHETRKQGEHARACAAAQAHE